MAFTTTLNDKRGGIPLKIALKIISVLMVILGVLSGIVGIAAIAAFVNYPPPTRRANAWLLEVGACD